MTHNIHHIPADAQPGRLDGVAAQAFGFGLRRCRTLISDGLITLDGRAAAKGAWVRPGQVVCLLSPETETGAVCVDRIPAALIKRDTDIAALFKPPGMHSVAGRGEVCLENQLPDMGLHGWMLANRLDCLTSGLVLACRDALALARYKGWQEERKVVKWYLAVAHGVVEEVELRGRILDDKRRIVRVTEQQDEPARGTRVWPVARLDGMTLVLARIYMGRRHQIRAHLAHAGHPLLGDPVYGRGEPGGLYLHHWQVRMPDFAARNDPDWSMLAPAMLEAADDLRRTMAAGSQVNRRP